jgi:23S rRNA (cytosine1962-C5)-methyltransferase
MTKWRLKPGSDRRFNAGHPWVYSNEIEGSPKGLTPGGPVTLLDTRGEFAAHGYGNPHSLIAFRVLSRDLAEEPFTPAFLEKRLRSAWSLRDLSGLSAASFRLLFGEADGVPGLVIDRYLLKGGAQVFVAQAHTAGADQLLAHLPAALDAVAPGAGLVIRNDLSVRKLEGIEIEKPRVARELAGVNFSELDVLIASASAAPSAPGSTDPLVFRVDLLGGQKTGFFLDQFENISLAIRKLGRLAPRAGQPLRILDLCCYVGQWGAQFARHFTQQGVKVEVTLFDGSDKALEAARHNVAPHAAKVETVRGDVLKDLTNLAAQAYDIVICDPPALIQSRKDHGPGAHAYLQLNTQAMRLLRPQGGFVSCSCSALFEEEELLAALAKAARRNRITMRWIGRGMPSSDHPMLSEFPEGRYLKGWIGTNA